MEGHQLSDKPDTLANISAVLAELEGNLQEMLAGGRVDFELPVAQAIIADLREGNISVPEARQRMAKLTWWSAG